MEEENIYEIDYSNQFKKDYKKYKTNEKTLLKIIETIKLLQAGGVKNIPANMKPHQLKGDYKGYLECHIKPDLLLIWLQYDEEKKKIILVRLGSHSELF